MRELDKTIARIKLIVADITSRESQLASLRRQLQTQLARLPRFALYGNADLDTVLSMMGDIEARLQDVGAQARRLESLKLTAQEELETLEITRRIQDQKDRLATLREQVQRTGVEGEDTRAEIERLQQSISEDSDRAAKRIMIHHGEPRVE